MSTQLEPNFIDQKASFVSWPLTIEQETAVYELLRTAKAVRGHVFGYLLQSYEPKAGATVICWVVKILAHKPAQQIAKILKEN